MSLPVNRDTVESILGDVLKRVRALEAKRQSSGGSGFGESADLLQADAAEDDPVEWTEACDPHDFFDSGDPTVITIPAGLSGKYVISFTTVDTAL